ncbi:MAG: choice-of-anchor Q domain-containing protein [Rhizonema sp. PD38]|nr:choice-of-anchor Q domain-containing protein [Rhizonema sp. PD38]
MDLSVLGATNTPLSNAAVFADNVHDLLSTGTISLQPSATIVVNSIADQVDNNNGVTTLRDAINQANADSGEDLIVFDRSLFSTPQTITLSLGELDITHNLDIIAPRDPITGSNLVSVSGNNATRVLEIETDATVNLSGLVITGGGLTGDNGSGISNSGTLNLDSTIVRNNNVTSNVTSLYSYNVVNGYGGGIYNTGTLNLSNSNVSNNTANAGSIERYGDVSGGGIYNTGNVFISNSTLSGNTLSGGTFVGSTGGGIYNRGSLVISNSTLSNSVRGNNYDNGFGGSIYNIGMLDVSNSTISGSAIASIYTKARGGGIYNAGTGTIINSTVSNSMGGGIYNIRNLTVGNTMIANNTAGFDGGGGILNDGTLTVSNSTISRNRTQGLSKYSSGEGGGILNHGILTVSNSTISGNTADGYLDGTGGGAGIYNSGTIEVIDSTISNNNASYGYGGGIYNNYAATLTLLFSTVTQNIAANVGGLYQNDVALYSTSVRGSFNVHNTIIASNRSNGFNPDVSGTFTSNGYNLIGDSTGSTGFDQTIGDLVGTSNSVIDPRLDILAFNGGPTQTIALLTDSPAIGAADPIILDSDPTTDQRGLPRRAADGSADIGAFQFS